MVCLWVGDPKSIRGVFCVSGCPCTGDPKSSTAYKGCPSFGDPKSVRGVLHALRTLCIGDPKLITGAP